MLARHSPTARATIVIVVSFSVGTKDLSIVLMKKKKMSVIMLSKITVFVLKNFLLFSSMVLQLS